VTEQDKNKQIATLKQQIAADQEKMVKLEAETKKIIEKRDQLNTQTKQASQQIRELRAQRDEINAQVRALKVQRDEARVKIKPLMEKVQVLNEKKEEIKKNNPKVNHVALQKEIDALEWEIQTTTLDMQDERRLVEEVKQLGSQLSGYKKIEKKNQKISELLTQRKVLDDLAGTFHKSLSELAAKGQEIHSQMLAKVEEAKKTRMEADLAHKTFIQNKEQIQQLLVEVAVLNGQLNGVYGAVRAQSQAYRQRESAEKAKEKEQFEQEKTRRMVDEKALKEKLGAQAKEKLERGEKVSWNEFALLADDDEEDEETQN
jgi:uncharacterized coiled-coil DUF342 family protein